MPELPEVETLRTELEKELRGKTISKIEIFDYRNANPLIKEKALSKIRSFRRRAKILIMDLENGNSLLFHLKLTGFFILTKKEAERKAGLHLIFHLKNDGYLNFYDIRKFGFIKLMKTSEVEKFLEREYNFGIEPLSKEFTWQRFKAILMKTPRSPIKPTLLDQTLVAGIGNIYAQEACFTAGILPTRRIQTLSDKEWKLLHDNIVKVLHESIKRQGTSADTYVTIYGKEGNFEPFLKVYQRDKCRKCHQKLKRIVMGGRGTWYCEKCQK